MFWLLITALAIAFYQKRRKAYSILLLLLLITSGYQLIPTSAFETSFGSGKGADFGVLGIIVLCLLRYRSIKSLFLVDKFAKLILLFIGFLFVAAAYSILVFGYDVSVVLRATRHFFILLSYFLLRDLTEQERDSIWSFLRRITTIQSVIFLLQIPLGISLLNTGLVEGAYQEILLGPISFTRYYSFPLFAPLFLFEGLWRIRHMGSLYMLSTLIILSSLIATLHRGLMFAIVVTTITVIAKIGLGRLKYAFIMLALIFALPTVAFLAERVGSGISDLWNALAGGYELGRLSTDTFSFRLAHLIERMVYVASSFERAIFGAGLLTEDAPQAERLGFIIGYPHPWGTITQVDTADIAWSPLIVKLGFAGTTLYVLVYLSGVKRSWQRIETRLGTAGFGYLAVYLIMSFTSSLFFDPGTIAGLCFVSYVVQSIDGTAKT